MFAGMLSLLLIVCMGVVPVHAQADTQPLLTPTDVGVDGDVGLVQPIAPDDITLDFDLPELTTPEMFAYVGIQVKQPTKVPGGWSTFWSGLQQKLVLLFTFDPAKDLEKRIQYAAQDIALAQFITENSSDSESISRAIELLDRAAAVLDGREDQVRALAEDSGEDATRALENLQRHLGDRNAYLEDVSRAATTEEQASELDTLRTSVNENSLQLRTEIPDTISSPLRVPAIQIPLNKRFTNDQDRDGIADDTEEGLGLSNQDFDTDGDGLSDKSEIEKYGTDPTKVDTDGDGYWDGFEIIQGYSPTAGLGVR